VDVSRYQKQILFGGIGRDGQARIGQSRVLLIGCGALGSVMADSMVRAGVGSVRIVDRDFVELTNLQRQILYDEQDVADQLPKAVAAARRLQRVNSSVRIEPIVADAASHNIRQFASDCDLMLDGTDNFEVRYLINDLSLETGVPWIFAGCTGSGGQVMPVFPGESACLRCLMPDPPPPGQTETCDTAGVLGPAIGMIASLQAAIALRILSGHAADVPRQLHLLDVWVMQFRSVDVTHLHASADCPACRRGERKWLNGQQRSSSTVLCGRNAVQVTPAAPLDLSLPELAGRLRHSGTVTSNGFLVRLTIQEAGREGACELTVFPDGRAIIRGTEDAGIARGLYARYVGS
jgi:adenylyltransferase/sulfurtransferase